MLGLLLLFLLVVVGVADGGQLALQSVLTPSAGPRPLTCPSHVVEAGVAADASAAEE